MLDYMDKQKVNDKTLVKTPKATGGVITEFVEQDNDDEQVPSKNNQVVQKKSMESHLPPLDTSEWDSDEESSYFNRHPAVLCVSPTEKNGHQETVF
jgi:hypothetical protein